MLTYMLVPMYKKKLDLEELKAAAKQIDPDIAFVVDCPANDIKGKQQLSGVLEGTLIRIKDGTMILKPLFRDYLPS